MSFNCTVYTINPTTVWPTQSFPKTLFPYWSGQRLTAAQKAWNYYEQVEAADSRLRFNATSPNIMWTPFDTQGARQQYNYGKWLHQQACIKTDTCNINWISQRDLGYSPSLTTIWSPVACSACSTGTLSPPCPY